MYKPKPKAFAFNNEAGIHKASLQRGTIQNYQLDIQGGDFVLETTSGNGQRFIAMSIDPLAEDTQSVITYNTPVRMPFSLSAPLSISQRAKHSFFTLEAVYIDSEFTNVRTPIAISSISQSGTTLTIGLEDACTLQRDERFHVYGLADSRLNYPNLTVATLSSDRKTITATVSDDATITSATIAAVNNSGYIIEAISSISNANGAAFRFSGSTVTSCALIVRGSGAKPRKSGTVGGADLVSVLSTVPVINNGGNGQFEIKPTNTYEIIAERGQIVFEDFGVDQATAASTVRALYDSSTPDANVQYNARLRATVGKSASRPIAKIVSAVKSGSTTATIKTDVPHGLQTGAYVEIAGIRDQTNFANISGITATVTGPDTLTVAMATSATATSYGGMVAVRNGQLQMVGYANTAIQSISIDENGIVTANGNTTWGTIVVGEYVNLHGVRNAIDGGDMGLDGVYQLIDLSTTTIKLIAVKDINGDLVKDGNGDNVTPTLNVMGTTNCGGAVIQRTTARLHDLKLTQYNQEMVKIWGQGEDRADLAVPVSVKNSLTIGAWSVNPSVATLTTAATTNATSAKTTAGQVFSLDVTNTSAAVIYLKLYNKTSAPTVGTDVPIATIPIPANSFATHSFGTLGKRFAAGISFAVTGAMAATDTTAVAAGCYVNLQYV